MILLHQSNEKAEPVKKSVDIFGRRITYVKNSWLTLAIFFLDVRDYGRAVSRFKPGNHSNGGSTVSAVSMSDEQDAGFHPATDPTVEYSYALRDVAVQGETSVRHNAFETRYSEHIFECVGLQLSTTVQSKTLRHGPAVQSTSKDWTCSHWPVVRIDLMQSLNCLMSDIQMD